MPDPGHRLSPAGNQEGQALNLPIDVTEGSLHLDLHSVLADDEHGVALMTISASRGGRSLNVNAVDVMHLRDGKVA